MLVVDPRGFRALIQEEASEFIQPQQLRLNSTVRTISHSKSGVRVTLSDGRILSAGYALCTFSLGVLQNDDVRFEPPLPVWKQEAIHSMSMVVTHSTLSVFLSEFAVCRVSSLRSSSSFLRSSGLIPRSVRMNLGGSFINSLSYIVGLVCRL